MPLFQVFTWVEVAVELGSGGAAVFGGQARRAAEAVVGVVGGDGTLRRLGQPVVLVIGIGAAVRT